MTTKAPIILRTHTFERPASHTPAYLWAETHAFPVRRSCIICAIPKLIVSCLTWWCFSWSYTDISTCEAAAIPLCSSSQVGKLTTSEANRPMISWFVFYKPSSYVYIYLILIWEYFCYRLMDMVYICIYKEKCTCNRPVWMYCQLTWPSPVPLWVKDPEKRQALQALQLHSINPLPGEA